MLASRIDADESEESDSDSVAAAPQQQLQLPLTSLSSRCSQAHVCEEHLLRHCHRPSSLNMHHPLSTRSDLKAKTFDAVMKDLAGALEQARSKLSELAKVANYECRSRMPGTPHYYHPCNEECSQAASKNSSPRARRTRSGVTDNDSLLGDAVPDERPPQDYTGELSEMSDERSQDQLLAYCIGKASRRSPGGADWATLLAVAAEVDDEEAQSAKTVPGYTSLDSLRVQHLLGPETTVRFTAPLRERWTQVPWDDIIKHDKELILKNTHTISGRITAKASLPRKHGAHKAPCIVDVATHGRISWWVCSPVSRQRLLWDVLSLALLVMDLVRLPLYVFNFGQDTIRMQALEWFCNIFWALDILMSFRSGFYVGYVVEMDAKVIALHYLQTWLAFDVCLILPEWVSRVLDWPDSGLSLGQHGRSTRYLRMARLLKIRHLTRRFDSLLGNHVKLVHLHSVLKAGALLCSCMHFIACAWFGIGSSSSGTWVKDEDLLGDPVMVQYGAAVRWTLAQLNGETDQTSGRSRLEEVFIIFCAVLALMFMSMLVSTFTMQMMEVQRLMDEDSRSTENLSSYLARRKVSYSVAYLTRIYLKTQKRIQSDRDVEARLFKSLPRSLMADLLYEVRSPTLCLHSFFMDLNKDHLKIVKYLCCEAVGVLQVQIAQVVFEREEDAQCTFITESGDLQYAEKAVDLACVANLKSREENMLGVMTSVVGGISHKVVPFTSVMPSAASSPDLTATIPGTRVSREGAVLAEGALWMSWQTRGALMAVTTSMLFVIYVAPFLEVLAGSKEALCHGAHYAHVFQWHISQKSEDEINDLTHLAPSQWPDLEQRDLLFSPWSDGNGFV